MNNKKGGERVNASKEKSHKEKSCYEKDCKKEDRKKEEVNFPSPRSHTFWAGEDFLQPLFLWSSLLAVFKYYKTLFLRKFQVHFVTLCKISINFKMRILIDRL